MRKQNKLPQIHHAQICDEVRPLAVVFDWDNTLVDSWEGIREAYNVTFRHFGMPLWSLEETQTNVAGSMRDTFPQIFGEDWKKARDVFYDAIKIIGNKYLNPLKGALSLLQWLKDNDIPTALVSNKNGALLRQDVKTLGWQSFFCGVVGASDCVRDKPAIDPVIESLKSANIIPHSRVWFVGDSHVDIICGQNAGCQTVLLHPSPPPLEDWLKPSYTKANCQELLALLINLPICASEI